MSTLGVIDLITTKRDGGAWSSEEIRDLMNAIGDGEIPDYQVAAICMVIFFRGMTPAEVAAMTTAIAESGEMFELRELLPNVLEQGSTGCVGDYGDLALLPALAAAGVQVAKVSGPPLGFINSIVGKLMATGAEIFFSRDQMVEAVQKRGLVVACHSDTFTPADRQLYAIRAVTGTIPSVPLIASGIMGKKIATGAGAIHLDVKYGEGAFLRDQKHAHELASLMLDVGRALGRKMCVSVYRMWEPLGDCVGGALEMYQAARLLHGDGPADLRAHVVDLGAQALMLTGKAGTEEEGASRIESVLANGEALAKFREWVAGQGGDATFVDHPESPPAAQFERVLTADQAGWLQKIAAEEVGQTAVRLGAGRERKDDPIDHFAGVVLQAKIGDQIEKGQPLATIKTARGDRVDEALGRLKAAFVVGAEETEAPVMRAELVLTDSPRLQKAS